jgi:hypothetical protein
MASSASSTDASPAGVSQTTPPSKSMPRLSPRVTSEMRPTAMRTALMIAQRRNFPTNS